MKKLLFCMSLVLVFISGCAYSMYQGHEEEHAEFSTEINFSSIEEFIPLSNFILKGMITDEKEFETDLSIYTVKVYEVLKGAIEDQEIAVYATKGTYQLNDLAILFLDGWSNELYPKPIYSLVSPDLIFIIDENKIVGETFLLSSTDPDEFIYDIKEVINKSPLVEVKVRNIIERATDQQELLNLANHVIHLKVKDVIAENKHVKFVTFEKINEYKGILREDIDRFALPSTVVKGEEYIVFMNETEEHVFNLATRQGSVISKNSEEWSILLEFLNN